MPGLVTSKKSVEEGGTSSVLGGYVSRLLQGLIPLSCYIFPCIFHSSCPFSSAGFSKKGRMQGTGFLVYVFSTRVLSLAVLVDFIGLYQGTFLACFCSYSFLVMSGLGRIILGLVLLFFLVVFS